MIAIAGECPNCGQWVDKIIHRATSIAPNNFQGYCEKCKQVVWLETMWVSQSITGKFLKRTDKIKLQKED